MMNANIIAHGTSRFREMFEHSHVVFNDNGTLSTKPLHPLTYIPEMSNGTEEDLVIMPNIALFVSITFVNDTRIRRNFYLFYQMRNTINVQRMFFSDKRTRSCKSSCLLMLKNVLISMKMFGKNEMIRSL